MSLSCFIFPNSSKSSCCCHFFYGCASLLLAYSQGEKEWEFGTFLLTHRFEITILLHLCSHSSMLHNVFIDGPIEHHAFLR